jgi:NADPH-dependent curcumin reductase CurA
VDELGFDGAWNYKTQDLAKELSQAAPDGFDVFFDNVGGATLELLLSKMKKYGRVILCGSISNYNVESWERAYGVRTLFYCTTKSLKLQGFIVSDWASEFPAGQKQLVELVQQGKLKVHETVLEGLESLPKAFLGLFGGDNQGKMVIKV